MTDQQPPPAPGAPRLSAEQKVRDNHRMYEDSDTDVEGNRVEFQACEIDSDDDWPCDTIKALDALRAERDEARAALAESRASNERLRAALVAVVDLAGDRSASDSVVACTVGSIAQETLASSPAAPTESAPGEPVMRRRVALRSDDECEPYESGNPGPEPRLLAPPVPTVVTEPAPNGYAPTAEAVEFPDAASAIAWLQADEGE